MFDYNALQLRNKVITVNTVCYSIFLYSEADRQGKFFQSNIEKRQGRRTDGQKNKHPSYTDRQTNKQTNKQTNIPIRYINYHKKGCNPNNCDTNKKINFAKMGYETLQLYR